MRYLIATILVLCLVSFSHAEGVKTISGTVSKVKTGKPYPFPTKSGTVWECKVKIKYIEYDPYDGDEEIETYKAYPINPNDRWMCSVKKGTHVLATVQYKKSEYRGEIIALQVLD